MFMNLTENDQPERGPMFKLSFAGMIGLLVGVTTLAAAAEPREQVHSAFMNDAGCDCGCVQYAEPVRNIRALDRAATRILTRSPSFRGVGLEDGSDIDLLVFYTPAVTANQGGAENAEALIAAAVLNLNTALANSLVGTQINLVDAQEIAYVEGASLGTSLTHLREPDDGFIDQVHELRDQHMADMVILVTTVSDVCGIANLAMGPGNTPRPEFAFGVVADTCALAPTYAFAHEIGHIMGLRHDWGIEPCTDGGSTEGKGYVEPGETFRTIMATSATSAPRILNFSNPNVTSGGLPTGADLLDPEPADAAAALNSSAQYVAKFRNKDCNGNGILDTVDIANLTLADCNANSIADICEQDFNKNGLPDACDITNATSIDADLDGVPDEMEPSVLFVDQAAAGTATGLDWANAFTDIQEALALARASGDIDEIWIASGTYRGNTLGQRMRAFDLVSGTALIGGFDGTEALKADRLDATPNPILTGDCYGDDLPGFVNRDDNLTNVIWCWGEPEQVTLERLIVEGGNADKEINCGSFYFTGAGIFTIFSDIVVRECEFRDCLGNRGAVTIADGTPMQFLDSHIHSNESRDVLGLYQSGTLLSSGSVAGAYFSTDFAGTDNLFAGNLVENNISRSGSSGATFIGGQPAVINSVFLNNTSLGTVSPGGGLSMVLTANARVTNCTVVGNTSPNFVGNGNSGLTISRAHVFVDNTICWGNLTGTGAFPFDTQQIFAGGSGGAMTLSHNTVQDWTGSLGDATNSGVNPRIGYHTFIDVALHPNSPAIDAGNNAAPDLAFISTDFLGNPRFYDDTTTTDTGVGIAPIIDIGAYEFQGNSAFTIEDLYTPGDGLITVDKATGLRWLDVTETTNNSWEDMQLLLAPGQIYEGFRYATAAEFDQLIISANIDSPGGWVPYRFGNYGEVYYLIDLLGKTFDQNPTQDSLGTSGMIDELYAHPDQPAHQLAGCGVTSVPVASGDSYASSFAGFSVDSLAQSFWGHFLIAPEPACEGDANNDGAVDVNDISFVLFRLGNLCPAPGCDGDTNSDGNVDVNDISYVLFRLGNPC